MTIVIAASFLLYLLCFASSDGRSRRKDEHEANTYVMVEHGSLERLFDDDAQNEMYAKMWRRHNASKFKSKHKKIHYQWSNETSRRRSNTREFYLIAEYTRVFGQEKFCRLRKDERFLTDYKAQRHRRYQLLDKTYGAKHIDLAYDMLDRCVYKNCFFTCDMSLARQADALLFHWSDLTDKALAIASADQFDKIYSGLFPFERSTKQLWILWDDEANQVNPVLDKFNFNWTISYQASSEASYCSYGCFVKRYRIKLNIEIAKCLFDFFSLKVIQKRLNMETRSNLTNWCEPSSTRARTRPFGS